METTLVPFATFPPCVKDCYHLYDANGACVPPAKPTGDPGTYAACFCADARVSPFSAGVGGVCDEACPGNPGAMTSLQQWFTGYCSANAKAPVETTTSATPTGSGSSGGASSGGGGDWISGHWRWVVFIIVIVLGIVGLWVGACLWRRHYIRKKDRQYRMGKALTSTGGDHSQRSVHMPHAGLFAPASISAANVYEPEKPRKERKKWTVNERT